MNLWLEMLLVLVGSALIGLATGYLVSKGLTWALDRRDKRRSEEVCVTPETCERLRTLKARGTDRGWHPLD